MDAADTSPSDGVMLAFLPSTPTDWCKTDLPHMTLVYAGSKSDMKPSDFSALAKDASSLAALARPFYLIATAVSVFGPDNDKVNVLNLQPTYELWAMRRYVESWNKSEFPFSPHVTIGPVTGFNSFVSDTPRSVGFDRLMLGWGDDQLVFSLRGSY